MLPTFVIGLREGLEAALIVGIVAAFLVQEGRRDAMRWVWTGVALGVGLSLVVGVGLRLASEELPQREQEQLETVIALVAVGMVTWMILWMRAHAAGLSGELRDRTRAALATGSTAALVVFAFLAVVREGFETAVFLVAVFNDAANPRAAGGGAVLGIAVAVGLGYAVYRGGVRIDLGRFFRVTGAVLVVVAAGLLATAVHTAHEAGWWHLGLAPAADLSSVVTPGTVRYALVTGVLGIQAKPAVGEVAVWLLYAVPMLVVVLRKPRSRPRPTPAVAKVGAYGGIVALAAVAALFASVPPALAAVPGGGRVRLAGAGRAARATRPGRDDRTIAVDLTDAGCPKRIVVDPGTTTFVVRNVDASKVSEFEVLAGKRVIGEKENLTPGLSGSFTVKLEPGTFTTLCPNGKRERGVLVVRGTPGRAQPAAKGTRVDARLDEFRIRLRPGSAAAGTVTFVARNTGGLEHELVVVRGPRSALVTDAGGAVDEDAIPPADQLGELEDLGPGEHGRFAAGRLEPGVYTLFCNVVERDARGTLSHYARGMVEEFAVR